jgi:hypothetical protein
MRQFCKKNEMKFLMKKIQQLAKIEIYACEIAGLDNCCEPWQTHFWLYLTNVVGIEKSEAFRQQAKTYLKL